RGPVRRSRWGGSRRPTLTRGPGVPHANRAAYRCTSPQVKTRAWSPLAARDQAADMFQLFALLDANQIGIVACLKIDPEHVAEPQCPGKSQPSVGADSALSGEDLTHARLRHPDLLGKTVGGDPHRFEEFLGEDFPGVGGQKIGLHSPSLL